VVLLHAQHRGDRLGHQRRIRQRRQLHQPNAIRVGLQSLAGEVQREPRLADARRPREREQAAIGQQLVHHGALTLAADKAR
jgi:hypothetical protein